MSKIIDMKAYLKGKNAQRRAKAKAEGIFQHCTSEPALPQRATCATCGELDRMRHRKSA